MDAKFLLALAGWTLKATVVFGLAFIATAQMRQNPAQRRAVWALAFVAVPTLALLGFFLPSQWRVGPSLTLPLAPDASDFYVGRRTFPIESWTISLWSLGVIVVGGYIAGCCRSLLKISRAGKSMPELVPQKLTEMVKRSRHCQIRISDDSIPGTAMTWGYWRPVVMLPQEAVLWDEDKTHAVLLHELAHIRRADSMIQSISLLVCAVLWFHPLVWFAWRQLRTEAEAAADEEVIKSGVQPSVYARMLLTMAADGRIGMVVTSSILHGTGVENRIRAILDPNPKPTYGIQNAWVTGITVAAAVSVVSAVHPFQGTAQRTFAIPRAFQDRSPEWKAGYEAGWRYSDSNRLNEELPSGTAEKAEIERKWIEFQTRQKT